MADKNVSTKERAYGLDDEELQYASKRGKKIIVPVIPKKEL